MGLKKQKTDYIIEKLTNASLRMPFIVFTKTRIKGKKVIEDDAGNGFYWADHSSPKGEGPFESHMACQDHWNTTQLEKHAITNMQTDGITPKSGLVIAVDFANKKRR